MESKYCLRRGEEADYADLIDFGNYVFQIDFRALLPKLYGNHPELSADHVLVTEPGERGERIRAMVGCFKIPLQVAGNSLLVRGIGTVSVHPYDRGKGYMKFAMHKAIDDAVAEGADYMVLSGRKQRYQHYGFDKCATQYEFELSASVYQQLRRFGVEGICTPVEEEGYQVLSEKDSREYAAACRKLYESQPVFAQREDFIETAESWRNEVRVLVKDGNFAGYMTIGHAYGSYTVNELVLREELGGKDGMGYLPAVVALLGAAIEQGAENVQVVLMPFQKSLIRCMTLIAEQCSVSGGYGIDVLHYASVAKAYLQVKADHEPVMDGEYVFEVIGREKVRLCVSDGKVTAENVGEDVPADIALPHLQMMNFLFAPTGQAGISGRQPALEKNWFPIPVCFSEQDNV